MNDATIGTWSYRAGDWFAVFGANTTLLLPASERERVVSLWALVDGGADFGQVLDGLLASGLSTLQGFVLVGADVGPTRILLRGDGVRATLTTDTETVELEGTGSSTWVERTVDDVTTLAVTLGEDSAGSDFPIDGGLVRVSRIDLPPAGQEPEAAAEPEPELTGPIVVEEPSPIMAEADEVETLEPPVSDVLQPWPEPDEPAAAPVEPDADPVTAHLPVTPPSPPPSPPSFGDLPPPPPPIPGPWGDGSGGDTGDDLDVVEEAAPIPPPPSSPPPSAPPLEPPDAVDSDHDGLTQTGAGDDEFAREHPGIPGQPMAPSVTRPVAKLIVSNGETVDVDRVVLIGRAPEARRFTSTEQPTLVTVPSPMHEISSTHVEVRPGSGADHGSAVVTDMGSTNGTVLVQPGLPPEDLKPGIAVQLIPGAIINLGDGLTIQVARP
jgi:hypothetical protein